MTLETKVSISDSGQIITPAVEGLTRQLTTWEYYSNGQLKQKLDAVNKGASYVYTPGGRLLTRTWARGVTTTYGYTATGQIASIDYSDATPDVGIEYDLLGRKTQITNGLAKSTFTYDPGSFVLDTETVSYDLNVDGTADFTRVIDRSQDNLGRSTGFELKDGTTVEANAIYDYQPTTGRLALIAGNASGTFTYGYEANSGLVKTINRLGLLENQPELKVSNTWEPTRDVLLTKTNSTLMGSAVTEVSGIDYTVNGIGQRTQAARTGSSTTETTWMYDALGQVTSADASDNAQDRAYEYDLIGNRQKAANSLTLPEESNYTSNPLNQYTAIPQAPAAPVFDDDGNMTTGPLPVAPAVASGLSWDGENRLRSTTDGSTTRGSYLYDAQSRRVAKTTGGQTTVFVYDGWNVIAEYSIQNSTFNISKTYLWGFDLSGSMQGAGGVGGMLSVKTGNSVWYPCYDGNGNITEYVDSAGSVAARFEYDPFGNTVVNTDSAGLFNYRFSTKPLDVETGLYYYGYRYLDPLTGRWPSRDPIEEEGGVNLYGFVGNDPIQTIDLFGFCSKKCIGKIEVKFTRSYVLKNNNPSWKKVNGVNVIDDPDHYRVSGRQFSGYMNVFDECGNLMEAFDVVSGGHREPGRPPGHDTPTPSGEYTFETKLKGSVPGYTIDNVPGRGNIQIHRSGTTTGCIATQFFAEQFDPLVEETRKDENCCKNKKRIPIEVWYSMEDGSSEPTGNTFSSGDGNDPGHKPDHPTDVVPPPVPPRAIPVPDPNNPPRRWWPF